MSNEDYTYLFVGNFFAVTVTEDNQRDVIALTTCFLTTGMDESLFKAGLKRVKLDCYLAELIDLHWITVSKAQNGLLSNGSPDERSTLSVHRIVQVGCSKHLPFYSKPDGTIVTRGKDTVHCQDLIAGFLDGIWQQWLSLPPILQSDLANQVINVLREAYDFEPSGCINRLDWQWIVINRLCMTCRRSFNYALEEEMRAKQLDLLKRMPQQVTERPHALSLANPLFLFLYSSPIRQAQSKAKRPHLRVVSRSESQSAMYLARQDMSTASHTEKMGKSR